MKQKSYIIGAVALILVTLGVLLFFFQVKKDSTQDVDSKPQTQGVNVQKPVEKKPVKVSKQVKQEAPKRYDLMNETTYSLSTVTEFAKLPEEIKATVKDLLLSYENVYTAYYKDAEVVLIVQEPVSDKPYSRHGLKKVVVSAKDGSVKEDSIGLGNTDENSQLDIWEYAKVSGHKLPVKHTKYNENKEIEFTEYWNYNPDENIKYEVKDQFGKPVSVLKETLENDSNLRQEHVFYDSEGNTKLSVSASYEGPNIVRFTYFNSEDSENNITSISEYQDGQKTKETVYNSDYKVKNVYTSDYEEGIRKDITVFDSDNHEVDKLLSKE